MMKNRFGRPHISKRDDEYELEYEEEDDEKELLWQTS